MARASDPDTDWDTLGGLRFALAAIVACGHMTFFFRHVDPLSRLVGAFGGKAAVVGFLLVSGYSIAASLQARPAQFYRRRLIRIYPLYLFALLLSFGLERATGGRVATETYAFVSNGALVALANLFLVQTFLVQPIAFDAPVWSLAVEVSYYVVAPALRFLPRPALLLLIAISAAAYVSPKHSDWGIAYEVFTRLNALKFAWAWIMGFYLYAARGRGTFIVFGACGAVLVFLNGELNPETLAPLTFLLSLLVLWRASHAATPPGPARLAGLLGDVSYPLYLLQYPAFIIGYHFLELRSSPALLGFGGLVAVAAVGRRGSKRFFFEKKKQKTFIH